MPIPPRSEEELNARLKAFISSVKGQRGALFSALLMPELVSSSLETGDVIASFTATADMRAADGFMAPGMVAALFDNALGMLSIGQMGDDTFTPTVDLHVNYYQSVPVGVPLRLHVRKERQTALPRGRSPYPAGTGHRQLLHQPHARLIKIYAQCPGAP